MTYTIEKTLPKAETVLSQLPLSPDLQLQVQKDQAEIKTILEGKDDRKILIIGPCSAWPKEAVIEYAKKLKPVAEKVSDKFKIVLRTYIQKPRTTIGWTGPLNQPNPYEDSDIEAGIYYCREMMIEAIKLGFPLADEALFTHNDNYFVDLLSWIAIGARSAEDQEHRIFASMIPHPVGLKNPTSGNLEIGVNSVIASQYPHTFAFNLQQIKTQGNPHAHLILRGGSGKPNCDLENILKASDLLLNKKVANPAIVVDISHDNSVDPATGKKDPLLQTEILKKVIQDIKSDEKAFTQVKGFMVESFLLDGNQNMNAVESESQLTYGKSVTDGCLGIEKTIQLIEETAAML